MENNHLTYFKVENFKKFDSLEVTDIGQFNLIVGDNNVGKTCLLEALLVDEDGQQLLDNFYLALTKRGFKFQIEEITKKSNNISTTETTYPKENYFKGYIFYKKSNHTRFSYNDKFLEISSDSDLIDSLITLNKSYDNIKSEDYLSQFITISNNKSLDLRGYENKNYWIYDYDSDILNFPLVSFNDTPLEEETIKIYETLKTKQEKEILLNALKVVNEKIVGIDFRGSFNDLKSVFLISYDDKNDFLPLNFMGDGFKRIFYIILKMLSLKGKRILIDEIEIGIHHSKMKDFWVNIFKVGKELDVQLFATTHSQECAQAFVDASKELEEKLQNELRLIELYEVKEIVYSGTVQGADNIEYSVKNLPFRGENIYG